MHTQLKKPFQMTSALTTLTVISILKMANFDFVAPGTFVFLNNILFFH